MSDHWRPLRYGVAGFELSPALFGIGGSSRMRFPTPRNRALIRFRPGHNARANQRTDLSQMSWALLGLAGILEIAFAFAMKSSEGFTRVIPALLTVATGLSSVLLLSFSLRTLPMGTGYAVWTGIGAAGTAILGMAVLGESAAPLRILSIVLILSGVVGLKLVPGN
jgi:quaternary ammonium compound-resistance protein SugE